MRLRLRPDPAQHSTIDGDEELLGEPIRHALASVIGGSGPGSTVDVLSNTDDGAGTWIAEIVNRRSPAGTATLLFTSSPRPDDSGPVIGSGLGIALARAISERHGGTVIVERTAEGDLTIRIELPLAPSRPAS